MFLLTRILMIFASSGIILNLDLWFFYTCIWLYQYDCKVDVAITFGDLSYFCIAFYFYLGSLCICFIQMATPMLSISELMEGSVGVVINTYIYDCYYQWDGRVLVVCLWFPVLPTTLVGFQMWTS